MHRREFTKGFKESQEHNISVVMLVIGDVSTEHRQFALTHASEIRDIPRVKFTGGSPDFSSSIYVFRPIKYRKIGLASVSFWDYRQEKE